MAKVSKAHNKSKFEKQSKKPLNNININGDLISILKTTNNQGQRNIIMQRIFDSPEYSYIFLRDFHASKEERELALKRILVSNEYLLKFFNECNYNKSEKMRLLEVIYNNPKISKMLFIDIYQNNIMDKFDMLDRLLNSFISCNHSNSNYLVIDAFILLIQLKDYKPKHREKLFKSIVKDRDSVLSVIYMFRYSGNETYKNKQPINIFSKREFTIFIEKLFKYNLKIDDLAYIYNNWELPEYCKDKLASILIVENMIK